MKIIVTIIPTNLVINFYPLFVLSYKPKTRIWFSASWWSGNEKYFYFLFIASSAVLQSHAKFNRLFIKEFSYMLFTWNFLTWIFLQVFPSIWHFLYHWDYAKFSYLIWLTNWLTDLCACGMENLDRIESDRTSNETDGAKNISNCNICWFELGILIIYSYCLNNNLLQQFVMYINVK